jgi:hypothetical protein
LLCESIVPVVTSEFLSSASVLLGKQPSVHSETAAMTCMQLQIVCFQGHCEPFHHAQPSLSMWAFCGHSSPAPHRRPPQRTVAPCEASSAVTPPEQRTELSSDKGSFKYCDPVAGACVFIAARGAGVWVAGYGCRCAAQSPLRACTKAALKLS